MQIDDISNSDRRKPLTLGIWQRIAESLGAKFGEAATAHNRLLARVERLERELEQARERSIDNYRGIYARNVEYLPGQYVTDRSSLWRCHTPTTGRPKDCPDWTLVAKGQ